MWVGVLDLVVSGTHLSCTNGHWHIKTLNLLILLRLMCLTVLLLKLKVLCHLVHLVLLMSMVWGLKALHVVQLCMHVRQGMHVTIDMAIGASNIA